MVLEDAFKSCKSRKSHCLKKALNIPAWHMLKCGGMCDRGLYIFLYNGYEIQVQPRASLNRVFKSRPTQILLYPDGIFSFVEIIHPPHRCGISRC